MLSFLMEQFKACNLTIAFHAGGSRNQLPITIDDDDDDHDRDHKDVDDDDDVDDDEPIFLFERPTLPPIFAEYAHFGLKRKQDQNDYTPYHLQPQPRYTWLRGMTKASLFNIIQHFSFQKIEIK